MTFTTSTVLHDSNDYLVATYSYDAEASGRTWNSPESCRPGNN